MGVVAAEGGQQRNAICFGVLSLIGKFVIGFHRSSAISSWIASITACGWSAWIICVLPGTTMYEDREESDVKSFCICDQAVAIGPGSLVS